MSLTRLATAAALSLVLLGAGGATAASGPSDKRIAPYAKSFTKVDRTTTWTLASRTRLRFPTYHPQGMALVGNRIFLSTVEILVAPVAYPTPVGGHDRTTGKGIGHVLVLTRSGKLIKDVVLGEGSIYHPGGIDFDGENVWVPVAEYRPNSRSIIYQLNPRTLKVREAFRVADHVGGTVRDRSTGEVHGVSWGSRTLFTWTPRGRVLDATPNPDHMLDYQDCAYSGAGTQLCSGVTGLPTPAGGAYELGGLALTSLRDHRVLHEVPFQKFSAAGHVVTRNPVALEQDGPTLRLWAAPDDGEGLTGTELLVYEAKVASR